MKTKTVAIDIRSLTINQNIIIGLAFFIPFLISGPQLLVGSLVNCFLILSIKFVDKKNYSIIAVLPSIAAVLNGLVFGKFTPFLIFFLPFIWLGNFLLIKSIVYLKNKLPLSFSVVLGVILKTIILYISALIYLKFNLVPSIFLTAMGVFQLITGFIGGLTTLIIFRINNFNYERSR